MHAEKHFQVCSIYPKTLHPIFPLVPIAQRVVIAINWINLYPVNNAIHFINNYLLNSYYSHWIEAIHPLKYLVYSYSPFHYVGWKFCLRGWNKPHWYVQKSFSPVVCSSSITWEQNPYCVMSVQWLVKWARSPSYN